LCIVKGILNKSQENLIGKNTCRKRNSRCYRFEQNLQTVSWNKEIKRGNKKIKFQRSTCAQYETPKQRWKTYGKPKIYSKLGMLKFRGHGHNQGRGQHGCHADDNKWTDDGHGGIRDFDAL
jgi:hypothetical protein